ncbi:hypothetical protein LguiB_027201 [Lonicera macranthoides]
MVLQKVSPDYITFTSLLHTSVELDDIEIGGQLHCVVVKSGWCLDCFVNSALVDLYAKFVNSALVNVVLWNVMVSCYMLNTFGVFKLMRLEVVMAKFEKLLAESEAGLALMVNEEVEKPTRVPESLQSLLSDF